jgi:hypothetical protein
MEKSDDRNPRGNPVQQSLMLTPNSYLASKERANETKPIPLAAATILKAMREARELYNLLTSTQDYRTWDEAKLAKEQPQRNVKPGSCIGNLAPHWSDITIHYYCQFPQAARACFTILSGVFAKGLATDVAKKDYRSKAIELCLVDEGDIDATSIYAEGQKYAKYFKAFYRTQEVPNPKGGGTVNLFNYMMLSQTYAFDFAQQQAVINAFSFDIQPKDLREKNPLDPLKPSIEDCNAYRFQRGIEYKDPNNPTYDPWPPPPKAENYCLPNKTFNYPLAATGR